MKKTIMPLTFAFTVLASCSNNADTPLVMRAPPQPIHPTQKIGKLTYTLIRSDVVGVEEDDNDISSFLSVGAEMNYGGKRHSVYFLDEGAVITEFHVATTGRSTAMPRPIRQMLNFEVREYEEAAKFAKAYDNTQAAKDTIRAIPGVN